jgi:hypothetical protein
LVGFGGGVDGGLDGRAELGAADVVLVGSADVGPASIGAPTGVAPTGLGSMLATSNVCAGAGTAMC